MTRLYLTLVFAVVSLSGLGMILYGVLSGRDRRFACEKNDVLGFADSADESAGFQLLDLDTGHEGLQHKEKEAFNPGKHKPEPI
jgi:hypothetical protein